MNKKQWILAIFVGVLLCLSGCSSKRMALQTKLSMGEFEEIAQKSAQKFLSDYAKKSKTEKQTIVISDFNNDTNLKFNMTSFAESFLENVRNSDPRFYLSATMGKSKEALLSDARKVRDDEEFNAETTKEKDSLLAPDLLLGGTITQGCALIDGDEMTEYLISIKLTDTNTGAIVWSDRRVIRKEGKCIIKNKVSSNDEEQETMLGYENNFFILTLEGGFGQGHLAGEKTNYAFRTRFGYMYRWDDGYYGFGAYGIYELRSQGVKITDNNTIEKLNYGQDAGLGLLFQASYFYASAGVLYDLDRIDSNFFSGGYKAANPFFEAGLMIMAKNVGLLSGIRYVVATQDPNYLNRGISGSIGLMFAI